MRGSSKCGKGRRIMTVRTSPPELGSYRAYRHSSTKCTVLKPISITKRYIDEYLLLKNNAVADVGRDGR